MTATIDEQLKEIQLATAQVDLKLKQLEYERKHSFVVDVLASPAVLAVALTASITGGTAIVSSISASHQAALEQQRSDSQAASARQSEIVNNIINSRTPCDLANKINLLLKSGLLKDDPSGELSKFASTTLASPPPECNTNSQ